MPIPILVLVSVMGFFVYTIMGNVAATIFIKKLGDPDYTHALKNRQLTGHIVRSGAPYSRTNHYAGNMWWGFVALTLVWPLMLAIAAVCYAAVGLFWGPAWIGTRVASYVAAIDSEETAHAA